MRDHWTCRCGHEFAFTGIGTRNCTQVPHKCMYDVTDLYDVSDYEPEELDEQEHDDEPEDDCLDCGMCSDCIDRSIAYAEEQQ